MGGLLRSISHPNLSLRYSGVVPPHVEIAGVGLAALCKSGALGIWGECRVGQKRVDRSHPSFFQSSPEVLPTVIPIRAVHPVENLMKVERRHSWGMEMGEHMMLPVFSFSG